MVRKSDSQVITLAHLLNGDPATEHGCDDRGFPRCSPTLGVGRRQVVRNCIDMPHNLASRRPFRITVFEYAWHHRLPVSAAVPTKLRGPPTLPIDLARRNAVRDKQLVR